MSINLSALMKQRYDTAANWTAQNPTLLAGEIGIESDTKKWKVGTGSTAWTSLTYAIGGTYPIVNADVAAAAAIAYSKLATLTSGNIVLGSAANVATSTAVTGDVTISNAGVTAIAAGVIVNADINASAAIVDTKLATIATAGKVSNSATTAASANTASAIVARDASGNFTAGTITAALTGAASSNVLKAGDTMTGVLAVTAGTAALPGIAVSGDLNTGIYSPGADQLAIATGGTEKARIDSSGRLLVGTSSERTNVYYTTVATTPKVQFETSGSSYSNGLSLIQYSASGFSPVLTLGLSASNTPGTNTAIASTHDLGAINFAGNDGTNFRTGASIICTNDQASAWAVGDCPGRLVFSTTADGAASPTERMRISQNGVLDYFSSVSSTFLPRCAQAANTSNQLIQGCHSATNTQTGTVSFIVYTNGNVQNTNNSYGAISDVKLKENIVNANSQWSDIKALQVRNYNLKEGQTHTQIGLVAQEVELVSPGLVYESPDRDQKGNDLGTVTKSVNYSVLYMKAVKALQEAMERIETLETRLSALEGA